MPSDFYGALAEIRRVTLKGGEEQTLYSEVCRIAVESGGALMAWIGLTRGPVVTPVAWAGPADRYVEGLDIRLSPSGRHGGDPSPTAHAVMTGRPYVCTDFLNDPRTEPWRDRAGQFGVRASLAHPFSRGGKVVGALNLYFNKPGICDAALVDLVELMAYDLGYALDHIDQQAAQKAAERAAKQHEGHLASIIDTALDAIIVVDARTDIVIFNAAASRMFGIEREAAIGKTLDMLIPPEHRDAHKSHMARFAMDGVTTRTMGKQYELHGLRANGQVFPMEASISRVGEGDHLLMTVMIRDLTLQRQAEKDQLARSAAEAANLAKTDFLSRMSHELRTPLNAILGFAQLLQLDHQEPLSPRQQQRVVEVLKAGQHLLKLIEEILDLSRIESGHMAMEDADVDLEALLDSVVEMSRPQSLEYQVSLEAAYKTLRGACVRADPQRLRQVMLNLVSNAIKYNRPGGWVCISIERQGPEIQIAVSDGGIGMTPQQRAGLFEPFNRLGRELSGVPGSGIGLVLVKQMVSLMHGRLDISSQLGKGTAVVITLPASAKLSGAGTKASPG
jgi:PAS domain S-box-containing protein